MVHAAGGWSLSVCCVPHVVQMKLAMTVLDWACCSDSRSAFLPGAQGFKEDHDFTDCRFPVLLLCPARCLAWLQIVVAVLDPLDPDGRRQLVAGDLFAAAEWIAFALQDQGRRPERLKMFDAQT